jgi:hypothetical protein
MDEYPEDASEISLDEKLLEALRTNDGSLGVFVDQEMHQLIPDY